MPRRPVVLFVSRERHRLPLEGAQLRKWAAVGDELDYHVLAAAQAGFPTRNARFRLVGPARPARLDGLLFYISLPFRLARELRRLRPAAAFVQGVHEFVAFLIARRLAGVTTVGILDVQGDWRAATRLYGSALRRLLNPLNDALAPIAVRRADGVRVISDHTAEIVRRLGVEPSAQFPPYVDAQAFLSRPVEPLADRPAAIFVGVLEAYKNVDGLARAWDAVADRVPSAGLHVVGEGTQHEIVARLVERHAVRWDRRLEPDELAEAMDQAWLLVLPSRAEGLGRVLVEAACRGRALVGSDRGGIPDVVQHEKNGLLVEPGDDDALADALVRVLNDRGYAERLGAAARETGVAWSVTPQEYAACVADVIGRTLARARP